MAAKDPALMHSSELRLHFRVIEPSRKRARPGDIFAIRFLPDCFHFGRVIRTDAKVGPMDGMLLVYLFRATSVNMQAVPHLSRNDLLIAPVVTNHQGWLRGYFYTVARLPLQAADVLPQHCFYSVVHNKYFDEYSKVLRRRVVPCGTRGVGSYSVIDYEMCKALGLDPSQEW